MIIEVRPSTEKDARYIGNNMRMEDIIELDACNTRPMDSVMYPFSCTNAQTFTLFYDKEPVLIHYHIFLRLFNFFAYHTCRTAPKS